MRNYSVILPSFKIYDDVQKVFFWSWEGRQVLSQLSDLLKFNSTMHFSCALWKVFSFYSLAVWKCGNHRNTKSFRRSHEKWGAKRSKTWQLFFMTFLSSLATPFKEHFCAEKFCCLLMIMKYLLIGG